MSKDKVIKTDEFEDLAEPKVYEVGYILLPLVAESDLGQVVEEEIIQSISSRGGEVVDALAPSMIRLAYPIRHIVGHDSDHYQDGYFGAVQFYLDPAQAESLSVGWKNSDKIIRFLMTVVPKTLVGSLANAKAVTAIKSDDEVVEEAEVKVKDQVEDQEEAPDNPPAETAVEEKVETEQDTPADSVDIDKQIDSLLEDEAK